MTNSLMARFGGWPIRRKLIFTGLLTSVSALFLAGLLVIGYQLAQYRRDVAAELQSVADMIAVNSVAPLTFGDAESAKSTLAPLEAETRVARAAIYKTGGQLFATYVRKGIESPVFPPIAQIGGQRLDWFKLEVSRPIVVDGEKLGVAFIASDMPDVVQRLIANASIIGVVMFAAGFVAFLVTSVLQRLVSLPIQHLADVARAVTLGSAHGIRAVKETSDELGVLTDAFNSMLDQIDSRDQFLETKVSARTAELTDVNRKLESREKDLHDSEERYALAAKGANDGLWDWKVPSNEIYFSPRWKQMLGYSEDEIKPDSGEWFSRVHPADRERVTSEIAGRKSGEPEIFACEYRIAQKNGQYIWVLCRGIAVRDTAGRIVRLAGSQTDITEGKVVDSLTGLRNRLYFIDKLEACLGAHGDGSRKFAVLFLDLDRFKIVNDSLGHDSGDQLLIRVAGLLHSSVRASDLVARDSLQPLIARFGGDEFAILLQGIRHASDASAIADRILGQLTAPIYLGSHPVFVSVSIGIAMGDSGKTPEDLLRNADAAMYYAKTRGKSRYEIFNEGIRDRALARLEIETDLRTAVDLEQFVVYYQPEVSLQSGKTVGFEALVRWQHPEKGLLQPSEFIPIAEETGLIIPIGRWVLRHACRQMAEWHRFLPADSRPSVSVNMSLKQLADATFVKEVASALRDSGLNPPSLRLELTESSIMANQPLTLTVLRQLKELNVGLELDDFGTGYSSLSYLHQLPFDGVKIDKSFITGMPEREGSEEMVQTILGMARSLKLDVVAEGVETEEQRDHLIALKCHLAQGFYYSKPIAAAEVEKTLRIKKVAADTAPALAELPGALTSPVIPVPVTPTDDHEESGSPVKPALQPVPRDEGSGTISGPRP